MTLLELVNNKNWTSYNRTFARLHGINEAILLSELAGEYEYWKERDKLDNGWFFSTSENIEKNTALTYKLQRPALKHLEELGLIKTQVRGLPATKWFYFDFNELLNKLLMLLCK